MIKTKIKINPFFWLIILGAILTGQFLEIITLFAIVIIHELGHVFAARSYGWSILEIHLLPFGGMAKVDPKTLATMYEEFIVAIAGPLQNFLMILVGVGFNKLGVWSDEWTTFFIQANLWIGFFNLLPIFPLDGEKLLKTFFYFFFTYRRANYISFFISMVLATILLSISTGIIGTMKINMNGLILAIFFLYINWIELKQFPFHFMKFLLRKAETNQVSNRKRITIMVNKNQLIIHALRLLKRDRSHTFQVLEENGTTIATISEEQMLECLFYEHTLYQPIHKIVT